MSLTFRTELISGAQAGLGSVLIRCDGRELLEQELPQRGVAGVRGMCARSDRRVPASVGEFPSSRHWVSGSMIRDLPANGCPNNAPLALWAGDPCGTRCFRGGTD